MAAFAGLVAEAAAIDVSVLVVCLAAGGLLLRRLVFKEAALLLAWVVFDDFVALTPIALHWNPGQWNWLGQIASLALALAVVRWRFTLTEVGLRWPQGTAAWLWTVGGVICALLIAAVPALTGSGSHPNLETFAYEAILPGPVEELVVRGVALAFLIRAFDDGERDRLSVLVAAVVTAIWFTAGHIIHLDDGVFHLTWARLWDVLPMSLLYVTVRLMSRSLFGGVLAHNAANILVEVVAAVRFP